MTQPNKLHSVAEPIRKKMWATTYRNVAEIRAHDELYYVEDHVYAKTIPPLYNNIVWVIGRFMTS